MLGRHQTSMLKKSKTRVSGGAGGKMALSGKGGGQESKTEKKWDVKKRSGLGKVGPGAEGSDLRKPLQHKGSCNLRIKRGGG